MSTDRPERALRLLVVDDYEVVRRGPASLLDRRAGFVVVAQAGTAAESVATGGNLLPLRVSDGALV